MEPNEIKAKAYIIGKQLEKQRWYEYSAGQAHTYCIDKAKAMGIDDPDELETIALMAMHFVIG
jgi:hypothetical protein